MKDKARILFVDDEKRVLNSMRGLFRRNYELFLTTVGADAVTIANENDIDVVVADQRMPGMTGIEVLGAIKRTSPRTVRILLTGYADPSAVEGSINIGEVFRFLSKPCPPKLLRETLTLAVDAAQTQPVTQSEAQYKKQQEPATRPVAATSKPESRLPVADSPAPQALATMVPPDAAVVAQSTNPSQSEPSEMPTVAQPGEAAVMQASKEPAFTLDRDDDATEPALPIIDFEEAQAREAAAKPDKSHWHSVTNVVMSEDTIEETQENVALPAAITQSIKDVGVVVFTVDSEFAETAIRALSLDRNTILATSLVKVAQAIEMHQAGVLVTDFTTNSGVLQKMIGALKQHMPELVTIVVSSGRDTTDMINLINYGQVFRYVIKPIEGSHLRNDVNAAAVRCLDMLNNPDLVKRHRVIEAPDSTDASPTLNRFLGRIRKIQTDRPGPTDVTSK